MKNKNQELLEMMESVDSICYELNNLSYNKKEDQHQIDQHTHKLDLIHKKLSGDITVDRLLKNQPKVYLQ